MIKIGTRGSVLALQQAHEVADRLRVFHGDEAGASQIIEIKTSGDRIQLQQVVLNLVHNAAEAMASSPNGTKEVRVQTSLLDRDTILVAVTDTGPGLDDTTRERMFDPLFTTKATGLGMGLRICTTIVRAHGGRLWAVPNPVSGLTVQFTLPRAEPDIAPIET